MPAIAIDRWLVHITVTAASLTSGTEMALVERGVLGLQFNSIVISAHHN